jgi:hypothetical protein
MRVTRSTRGLEWGISNCFGGSVDRGSLNLASRNRRELLARLGDLEDLSSRINGERECRRARGERGKNSPFYTPLKF